MPEHTPAPTPSRAVYGFVLFLCSNILFILYLTWAVLPEQWFAKVNITYLPQRYWAVVIPVFLLTVLATFAFVIYPSLSFCMTPNIDDIRTIADNLQKYQDKTEENNFKNVLDNEKDHLKTNLCICKVKHKCLCSEYKKACKNPKKCSISMAEDLCIADVSRTLYKK